MLNCTYIYKGKKYSKKGIESVISKELPTNNQEESISFLQNTMGMSRDEIIIIVGLIENKALGRFKGDGRILLSDKSDITTAKHEAFHRVWRLYLTPKERADVIRQFKYKSNWRDLIENYKKNYPKLTEEELIEEYFAHEFEDYQIQPNSYNIQPLKSIFQKIIDFIKKVLRLNRQDYRSVFDRILNKEFIGQPRIKYSKDADSIFVGPVEISVSDKNDLVNFAVQQIVNKLVNKKIEDSQELLSDLKDYVWGQIDQYVDEDLSEALGEDFDNSGNIWTEILNKFSFFNIEIEEVQLVTNSIETELNNEDQEIVTQLGDSEKTREFTQAIKINPKDGLSSKIKMLLSSFQDPVKRTSVGVPVVITASTAFAQISARMAGVPTSYFLSELERLDLTYIPDLLKHLGKTGEGWSTKFVSLRNEFISKLALTENNFTFFQYGVDEKKKRDIRFVNLNSESRTNALIRQWSNTLTFNLNIDDQDNSDDLIKNYFNSKFSRVTTKGTEEILNIADAFGITLDERTIEKAAPLLLNMKDIVLRTSKFKEKGRNWFDRLKVESSAKKIAQLQSVYSENVDLMVPVLDTKIYTLGLNTYQTSALNKAKFHIRRLTEQGLDQFSIVSEMRKIMPEMFNNWNITQTSDGIQVQPLLSRILNEDFDIAIPYITKNEEGDEGYIEKMSEPELVDLHINGAVTGNYMSMKHSDRSTFFSFKTTPLVQLSQIIDPTNIVDKGLNMIVEGLATEIKKEVEFDRSIYGKIPTQYLGNPDHQKKGYTSLIPDAYSRLYETGELTNEDYAKLKTLVYNDFSTFLNTVKEYRIYEPGVHVAGLSKTLLDKIKAYNLPNINPTEGYSDNDIKTYLVLAYVNEHLFHMYESRLFTGDNRMFKSSSDLYKRLATQSSNGLLPVTDEITNQFIKEELNREYSVFNIHTGETITVNTADNLHSNFVRSITLKEEENYKSRHLKPSGIPSKLGISNPTVLSSMLEYGFWQDNSNPTPDQIEAIVKKIEAANKKYSEINENDGQSYMTLPAFKNYMLRFGTWTDEMDVSYQVEMALLQYKTLEEAKDLEITITGNNKYAGLTFKPFEIEEGSFKKRKLNGGKNTINLEAMHTLKVQYAGPSIQEIFSKGKEQLDYSFFTVYKTSNHLLQPSAIIGTNLQSLNTAMLVNNVQVVAMGSANKVGGVDPKLAAKNDLRKDDPLVQNISNKGLSFYKDGKFNYDEFILASDFNTGFANTLFNWEYYKDQVKIGNKEKEVIPGSTQSLKIVVSNLLIHGEERFPGARQIVEDYSKVIDEIVERNQIEFLDEINADKPEFLESLKRVVMKSSQIQNAPDNIKNTIENFFEDSTVGLESLTLRQKIENVLYSLVTSNVINFNRHGTSYPQAASTGYEPFGQRQFEDGFNISQELDFYEPVFDEEGNLEQIKPAEIIIPLPTNWIPSLLKAAKTKNLITALDWLNKQAVIDKRVNEDRFVVKGLRIPNQQLSSNDIFRIKKFTLPTIQSYAIVPSEIVVKVGSDLRFMVRVKLG